MNSGLTFLLVPFFGNKLTVGLANILPAIMKMALNEL